MTGFDDRKSAFENKFKHDQDVQFKVNARRNKLVGLWAAEKLGKTGPDADAYAKEVVASDFEKAGDDDVIEKLEADLKGKGVSVADIKAQFAHFMPIAKQRDRKSVV